MESLENFKNIVFEKYKNLNQKRLEHILGVVEMSKYLAEKYDVNVVDAMIASYMHDYCKYDDPSEIEKLLNEDEITECREYPFLYHAYGSAYMYKKLGGKNEDIFNAIYNHVFGRENMSMLEAIVMISDYTEINRKYESCIECRKILMDGKFNEAVVYSLEKTIKHCEDEGQKAHPRQIKVLEEYRRKVSKMTLEELILDNLERIKAEDVLVYDMTGRSPFYDKMILCSVQSERQATAAISYIEEETVKNGYKVRSVEGANTSWVLIDCYDVIVSIFTREERNHFAVEKIYMDVPVKKVN